jgi:hypothetical protein
MAQYRCDLVVRSSLGSAKKRLEYWIGVWTINCRFDNHPIFLFQKLNILQFVVIWASEENNDNTRDVARYSGASTMLGKMTQAYRLNHISFKSP